MIYGIIIYLAIGIVCWGVAQKRLIEKLIHHAEKCGIGHPPLFAKILLAVLYIMFWPPLFLASFMRGEIK